MKDVFSKDVNKYVALAYMRCSMEISNLNTEYFGFHIPVVKEDDDFFYALCIEMGQVAYGSTIENAFDRMETLVITMFNDTINETKKVSALLNYPMSDDYLQIYHTLKNKYNLNLSKRLEDVLSHTEKLNSDSYFPEVSEREHTGKYKMKNCDISFKNKIEYKLYLAA